MLPQSDLIKIKFHISRQDLIRGVQEEFNKIYPFLKIEFSKKSGLAPGGKSSPDDSILHAEDGDQDIRSAAKKLLLDFGLSDEMKVTELEILLQYQFGLPVQILRKSGNLWMDTRMSRDWTLRQQNGHGKDIASGFE